MLEARKMGTAELLELLQNALPLAKIANLIAMKSQVLKSLILF